VSDIYVTVKYWNTKAGIPSRNTKQKEQVYFSLVPFIFI